MHSKKNFLNRVETGHVRLKKGSKHFYTNLLLKALIVTKQLIRTCFGNVVVLLGISLT